MTAFTPLEKIALDAILAEAKGHCAALNHQLACSYVCLRQNTGGGFLTELTISNEAVTIDGRVGSFGNTVWIGIEGLELGLGMILHLKDGRVALLEGYAVGPEDTSAIDFAHVPFAVISEPGSLPPYGS